MGRRSINTTKSGKYMNPTDQARKEARKKELKKNKRQRQIVRTAVLRGKDPMQLLGEMEKIDQMEYNVLQPSPLNEKVLKDKRKKLRDTFDRVMKMYYKDDPEKWKEIRRAEGEYEKRRANLLAYFEAVRFTQQVSVDEIPLPMAQMNVDSIMGIGIGIPMPNEYGMLPLPTFNAILPPPPGILRKKSMYSPPPSPSRVSKLNKIPPGVPPGPPPELSGEEDEGFEEIHNRSSESDDSDKESRKKKRKVARAKAIRFAESESSDSESEEAKKKSKSYSSGHDIDQFMKEMEEVHKKKEAQRDRDSDKTESEGNKVPLPAPSGQMPSGLPPAPPLGVPPHLMYRPPPMMMGHGGIRLPPGPPPGPPPGMPPRLQSSGIRLPPGPPSGVPPSMMRFSSQGPMIPGNPNVVSAAPQLINREGDIQPPGEEQPKSSATIEAKAKIRNLNADITRFMPMSVRIKRDDGKPKPKPERRLAPPIDIPKPLHKPIPNSAPNATQPSKDDAYMQFMKEMQGFL